MVMFVVSLLRWWYSDGWARRAKLIALQLEGTMDYFSIDLLLKTLFAPFRQISAGKVDGPLGVQMRAMVDKLVSRVIGAMVRLVLLLIGIVTIIIQAILGLALLAVWAFIPVLPLIGLGLTLTGWAF